MTQRVFNFSPGPATLPEEVLRRAAQEMLDWHGSGMSVMEMSHRGKEFVAIHAHAERLLRDLLGVPEHYKVLFLQGGAIGENAIVPMNLLRGHASVDIVDTGEWSLKTIQETRKYAHVNIAASSAAKRYTCIPPRQGWRLDPDAAYVHICSNETIGGVQYHFTPDVGAVPLVADMSSDFMSRPIDVSKFGLIYAGAQKNLGPAGVTIVIVREDLLGHALPITPSAFDYGLQAQADSMLNTPPTWAIYMVGLVLDWIQDQGGLAAMERRNKEKAGLLYQYLEGNRFYANPVAPADRSLMNVPFTLRDPALDDAFLKGAQAAGLVQLKGHRSVGGMRASIYNAMSLEGVSALVAYMKGFEARHG
ncbi:3-phosphoserine/phosphohydroxythreonine transaminase [Variovorax dokdonensis]|uniref:Phosphoserine aminotransferase n=1 Tax=Variovorax dokdonensis TaxID=344883 RepID=A0ABT7N8T5_9BURK|nr:3-phosphoserine/phosphohydroxythreonine transaminase [Variovorax dokdonensis]MDM0044355.1 3-phosphoserine/phosphohydroxythreonine transaminase [Variovorax dokdonensis]